MTTYVDTSALMKRYVEEDGSDIAEAWLRADPVLVTSWVTLIETRRNLARLLGGADLVAARQQCVADLDQFALLVVDEPLSHAAAEVAEVLGVRSPDAVHLASAERLRVAGLTFLTFDFRQAQAARSLGFTVVGV
jgi:predicted nucleic acid-binding protein